MHTNRRLYLDAEGLVCIAHKPYRSVCAAARWNILSRPKFSVCPHRSLFVELLGTCNLCFDCFASEVGSFGSRSLRFSRTRNQIGRS